jgi:hypothetical protein
MQRACPPRSLSLQQPYLRRRSSLTSAPTAAAPAPRRSSVVKSSGYGYVPPAAPAPVAAAAVAKTARTAPPPPPRSPRPREALAPEPAVFPAAAVRKVSGRRSSTGGGGSLGNGVGHNTESKTDSPYLGEAWAASLAAFCTSFGFAAACPPRMSTCT